MKYTYDKYDATAMAEGAALSGPIGTASIALAGCAVAALDMALEVGQSQV